MSKKVQFYNFMKNLDVGKKICQKQYCSNKGSKWVSSCHKKCNDQNLGSAKTNEYKSCQTECNKEKEARINDCKKVCKTKKGIIQEAVEKYCEDKENRMLREGSPEELEKHTSEIIKAKLQYEKSIEELGKHYNEALSKAKLQFERKQEQAETEYIRRKEVNSDEIKKELFDVVKEIMGKFSYKPSTEYDENIIATENFAVYGTEPFVYQTLQVQFA